MGYETIVTLPDGTKAKGKIDSIIEGLVTVQMIKIVDIYVALEFLQYNTDSSKEAIRNMGEHPDLLKEFPSISADDECMYLLCNGTLFLKDLLMAFNKMLIFGLKSKQISKFKNKVFKEYASPIRESAENLFEQLKKEFS
jgi:hypothetical protein